MHVQTYQIQLAARNQGLHYRDSERTYYFELARNGKTWVVQLPPTDAQFKLVKLSEIDIALLIHRIQKFLSRIWWFGIWPVSYQVAFCDNEGTNRLVS